MRRNYRRKAKSNEKSNTGCVCNLVIDNTKSTGK